MSVPTVRRINKTRRQVHFWLPILLSIELVSASSAQTSRSMNPAGNNKLTYHYNPERTGWNDREVALTPRTVSSPAFGLLWQSLPLDYFNGTPPRLFATPLYVNNVEFSRGQYAGDVLPALYVVTTTAFAYALSAAITGSVHPGTVL